MFSEDDLIPISGLQHLMYCERQFALIHVEQLWAQNRFTVEGESVDQWLYRGYTISMKTAVSLPDRLYSDAEKTARAMGIPRSQLFALALEEFISHHTKERITEQLNEVYGSLNSESSVINEEPSLESMRELTQNDAW